jgi:hypothetical protein
MTVNELLSAIRKDFHIELDIKNIETFYTRNELQNKLIEDGLYRTARVSHGVYIIGEDHKICYIRSSGKLTRNDKGELQSNGTNGIGSRILRSSAPNAFLVDSDNLGWKKIGNDQRKTIQNYLNHIPLSSVSITILPSGQLILPSVLEFLLLQVYHANSRDLPMINNQV